MFCCVPANLRGAQNVDPPSGHFSGKPISTQKQHATTKRNTSMKTEGVIRNAGLGKGLPAYIPLGSLHLTTCMSLLLCEGCQS